MLHKSNASTWESQHLPAEKTAGMPYNRKGEKQIGRGQSDSTRESGESRRREAERGQFLKVPAVQGNIEKETLAIHRGGIGNGNEIEENIAIIKREPGHGIYIHRAFD